MGKMYFAKEETSQQILSAVNNLSFSGGGDYGVELAPVTNAVATNGNLKNFLKWKDPKDAVIDGATLSRWAGTKVVRKVGSAPTSPADGEVILDSKVKNAYEITPYEDTGLTADVDYYYAFFPYNTKGVHTVDSPIVSATPKTDKAPATMTADKNTATVYAISVGNDSQYKTSADVIITTNSDGGIVVFSDNTDVAIAEIKNKTVTVTAIGEGTAKIVVSQLNGTDFVSPKDVIISVNVMSMDYYSNIIQIPWAGVKQIIESGLAESIFDTGDIIPIKLNGELKKADDAVVMTFDDDIYYATVLGFNHNTNKESPDKNSMHFIVGKDPILKKDIAFNGFPINPTNQGGWKTSQMRNITCASFYDCLSVELKAVVSTITKYTDNVGGISNSDSTSSTDASATQDKIFLLSEYEVHGAKTHANDKEASYQLQYDYYKNGNSKISYDAEDKSSAVRWWCRSARTPFTLSFCLVAPDGTAISDRTNYTYGFVPGFAITG